MSDDRVDTLPNPARRWAFGEHADCLERPLEPGDELTIANATPHRLRVVAARECDPADPRHAAWTERCGRLERERDALIAEVHRARHDAHAAAAEAIARIVFWGMMTALILWLAFGNPAAREAGREGWRPEATATATEGEPR